MLTFYGSSVRGAVLVSGETLPENVDWIDAFSPTDAERDRLRRLLETDIPTLDDLLEIETSSRLSVEGSTIVMSLTATVKDETGYPKGTPIGFVVTPGCVATIRFARLQSFEQLAARLCGKGELSATGVGATVSLLEILVDQLADLLEHVGGDLDRMSHAIFADGMLDAKTRRPRRSNQVLTQFLTTVGRNGDFASKVSETLLGLSRMAPFLQAKAGETLTPDFKVRLDTVATDTKSLHEYQEHLSNKTQFLLDTLLGLANIEQNNVFRVLTVVSVIGIPPTFLASMYGMNFKSMPEYDWAHGYAYALTLIAFSAIAPAIWFKVKGWW